MEVKCVYIFFFLQIPWKGQLTQSSGLNKLTCYVTSVMDRIHYKRYVKPMLLTPPFEDLFFHGFDPPSVRCCTTPISNLLGVLTYFTNHKKMPYLTIVSINTVKILISCCVWQGNVTGGWKNRSLSQTWNIRSAKPSPHFHYNFWVALSYIISDKNTPTFRPSFSSHFYPLNRDLHLHKRHPK